MGGHEEAFKDVSAKSIKNVNKMNELCIEASKTDENMIGMYY
jgi:hypothetical protein